MFKHINTALLALLVAASCSTHTQAINKTTFTGILMSTAGTAWSYFALAKALAPIMPATPYKKDLRHGMYTALAGLCTVAYGSLATPTKKDNGPLKLQQGI